MITIDLQVDIIPNVELGEDEKMQSQSSRDTKVFGEQFHLSRDAEVTQEKFQQHEEMGGQYTDTQEPVALHPPVKAKGKTQVDVEIEIRKMLSHKNQHLHN